MKYKNHSVIRTDEEIAASEADPIRLLPSPSAITRMEATLKWITWVEVCERKLVCYRASNGPWRQICREISCPNNSLEAMADGFG